MATKRGAFVTVGLRGHPQFFQASGTPSEVAKYAALQAWHKKKSEWTGTVTVENKPYDSYVSFPIYATKSGVRLGNAQRFKSQQGYWTPGKLKRPFLRRSAGGGAWHDVGTYEGSASRAQERAIMGSKKRNPTPKVYTITRGRDASGRLIVEGPYTWKGALVAAKRASRSYAVQVNVRKEGKARVLAAFITGRRVPSGRGSIHPDLPHKAAMSREAYKGAKASAKRVMSRLKNPNSGHERYRVLYGSSQVWDAPSKRAAFEEARRAGSAWVTMYVGDGEWVKISKKGGEPLPPSQHRLLLNPGKRTFRLVRKPHKHSALGKRGVKGYSVDLGRQGTGPGVPSWPSRLKVYRGGRSGERKYLAKRRRNTAAAWWYGVTPEGYPGVVREQYPGQFREGESWGSEGVMHRAASKADAVQQARKYLAPKYKKMWEAEMLRRGITKRRK